MSTFQPNLTGKWFCTEHSWESVVGTRTALPRSNFPPGPFLCLVAVTLLHSAKPHNPTDTDVILAI